MTAPIPLRIQQAVGAMLEGGVIAYPTEGVWGLGCDPQDEVAVDTLLALKQRPRSKGLILVAADEAQLEPLLFDLSDAQRARLSLSWPGPNTWLVPHHGRVPEWVTGEHDTVALRVSNHPLVRDLCLAWGGPIVSTSANRGGAQAAEHAFQVRRYFGGELTAVLPGAVQTPGQASTIRDLETDQVLRA